MLLLPILLLLSACGTNIVSREITPDSFCLIYKPTHYSRSHTPQDLQDQIDQMNAKYDANCKASPLLKI
jgi:hypothetical protein